MNTHGAHVRPHHVVLAACVLVLPLVYGCQRDADRPPMLTEGAETPSATADSGALVTQRTMTSDSLQVMSVGGPAPFVADSDRRAVYMLEGDTDGSGCSDDCLRQWAPVYAPTGEPDLGEGLAPALLDVVTRADGTRQMSYGGHPLYHYGGDTARGDVTGHDVRDTWGHWRLLTPQGQPVGEPVGALRSDGAEPPVSTPAPDGDG